MRPAGPGPTRVPRGANAVPVTTHREPGAGATASSGSQAATALRGGVVAGEGLSRTPKEDREERKPAATDGFPAFRKGGHAPSTGSGEILG
ncbi:hypothetical protein Acsp01_71570 [Actinoplanes sp. NBRC 101535]|nr:hypothetical protein Acsp01_71570 [Actinoplanes sp. NBRC 101535]